MNDYIHGTTIQEQERLKNLNLMTNNSFIELLGDCNGLNICDFGCGMGNLMTNIAKAYPSAHITGLELSSEQYKKAVENIKEYKNIKIINTNILQNNLPENHYDLTYCRYVLEHVSDPIKTVKEMYRVTKPGGVILSQENDLYNLVYDPEIKDMEILMKQFCELQILLGGDPYIGRKLFNLFREVGLVNIELSYEPEIYSEFDRKGYKAWMQNILGILFGAKEELLNRKLIKEEIIDNVCNSLRERIKNPTGVALFHWNRIKAQKSII